MVMRGQQWNRIGHSDAQTNLGIAKTAREEGTQMRFIAFLGMLFLPGTFAAVSLILITLVIFFLFMRHPLSDSSTIKELVLDLLLQLGRQRR